MCLSYEIKIYYYLLLLQTTVLISLHYRLRGLTCVSAVQLTTSIKRRRIENDIRFVNFMRLLYVGGVVFII